MLEVSVDKILPSPSGLRLGCTIRYGKEGPIRFAAATIPWSAFGRDTRAEMLRVFNRMVNETLAEEPTEEEPLF